MDLYVDTILALAIHCCEILDEEIAVKSLISNECVNLDQINHSRRLLQTDGPTKRNSIESGALDIIKHIQGAQPITKRFVIDPIDLIKLPGLSKDCLELTNFQLGIRLAKQATKIITDSNIRESNPVKENIKSSKQSDKPSFAGVVKRQKGYNPSKTIIGNTENRDFQTKTDPETVRVCQKVSAP